MSSIKWDPALETGIPIVDEQHQSLFRQVDDLLDPSKADRVEETLAFLGDYVIINFGTEELMQKASKYPKAADHKKQHDDFIVVLTGLKTEYKSSGGGMLMLMKITKLALDWLQNHISGSDKEFGDYFKASGLVASGIASKGR